MNKAITELKQALSFWSLRSRYTNPGSSEPAEMEVTLLKLEKAAVLSMKNDAALFALDPDTNARAVWDTFINGRVTSKLISGEMSYEEVEIWFDIQIREAEELLKEAKEIEQQMIELQHRQRHIGRSR